MHFILSLVFYKVAFDSAWFMWLYVYLFGRWIWFRNNNLSKMDLDELKQILAGEPTYRFKQVHQFLFKNCISSWDEAFSLPKSLRDKLNFEFPLELNVEFLKSKTGDTEKALIELVDGKKVETVLMRHSDSHNTICVSCQVGCSMNCDFCATGKMGLKRNLSVGEIIAQVLVFARVLTSQNKRISNVVFMGMGEPFLNYDNVMAAIRILNDENAFNIAARKISVSTCGIIPGIDKFANEDLQLNLALSLHAPNSELRSQIMPVNDRFDIVRTLSSLKNYVEKTGRKVMIEYLLLDGVNDSEAHARELASLLRDSLGNLFMINLISYNMTTGKYRAPKTKNTAGFKKVLESRGLTVTQRFRLGHDIEGACGQLATESDL
jgi:23S rRNA (adenine2503-C2)-methyltransferase